MKINHVPMKLGISPKIIIPYMLSFNEKIRKHDIIILHDTGVNRNQNERAINNYHKNTKKWKDGIGYDIYIDKEYVYFTRRLIENIRGAHAGTTWNKKSIGICLSGKSKFNQFQLHTLEFILKTIIHIKGYIKILYHKELSKKRSDPHKIITDMIEDKFKMFRGEI